MEREFIHYLNDIHFSMERILDYTSELNFSSFTSNQLIVDAVIRNFEIIGEASNKIPLIIKNKYPNVPWQKMYSLRNLVIHEYFGIDHHLIWEIITSNLNENLKDIKKIINIEE